MKNLKFIGILMFGLTLLNGCLPDPVDTFQENLQRDEQQVISYLNNNNVKYEKYTNGCFYSIVDSGKGSTINDTSVISFKVNAKNLSGTTTINDTLLTKANWDISYSLRLGINKVRIGGEVNVYIPAYLNDGSNAIAFNCKPTTLFKDQAAADDTIINAYLKKNSLTAIKDTSGIYYNFSELGTGSKPTLDSVITVTYTAKLTNDRVFDQTTGTQTLVSPLNKLILGWQLALPKLAEGGKGRIYIPSRLGYGKQSNGIPANSVLIFDISLINVAVAAK